MAPSDKESNGSFLPEQGPSDTERPVIANLPLKGQDFVICQQLVHTHILTSCPLSLRQSFTLLDTGPESREPPEGLVTETKPSGLWGRFRASLLFATDQLLDRSYFPGSPRLAERLFLGIS